MIAVLRRQVWLREHPKNVALIHCLDAQRLALALHCLFAGSSFAPRVQELYSQIPGWVPVQLPARVRARARGAQTGSAGNASTP